MEAGSQQQANLQEEEMLLLEQEWLADEAAQVEYESWLASTHRTNTNEPQQSH